MRADELTDEARQRTDEVLVTCEALLLDIGDVITELLWLSLDRFEAVTGRRCRGRGPLDPGGDALWQRFVAGEITRRGYWQSYAASVGYDDWRDFVRDVSTVVPEHFADPDAIALMRDARAAGRKVGVLTNDGIAINGYEFFMRIPEFAALEAFIDASQFGGGKPAPEPYLHAARMLNVEPSRVVFLDDMADCVEGANAVGMNGVLVDPLAKRVAFTRARVLLGLPSPAAGP